MAQKYEPTREDREERKQKLKRKREVERMRLNEAQCDDYLEDSDWGGEPKE